MKNFKDYGGFLSFITSGAIVVSLCGCSHEKVYDSSLGVSSGAVTEVDNTCTTSVMSSTTISSLTTSLISTSTSTGMNLTTVVDSSLSSVSSGSESFSTETTSAFTDNDSVVLNYFGEMAGKLNDFSSDDFLYNAKMYFVYCVDFLFYDGEIKGIKFDDLSLMAKQQLLRDISFVDSFICSYFPNYKETISTNAGALYDKAASIIKEGADNINDFSREKLGEENYSKLEMCKDLFIDQTINDWNDFVDILGKGKSKFDDWYYNFKSDIQ